MEDKLLKPEEVAEKLGLSRKTIIDWCKKGKIEGVRVGGENGQWRIPETAISRIIKGTEPLTVRKIAVALSKGGTGKTTTAINMSCGLALRGFKTLLVDTDTQGQVSPSLSINPAFNLADVITGKIPVEKAITMARLNLDVIAGGKTLAGVKPGLTVDNLFQTIYGKIFSSVEKKYDFIIFDTGPSYEELNISAFHYVKEIVIPIETQALPLLGLESFVEIISLIKGFNPKLNIKYLLPTKFDKRTSLSDEVLSKLKEYFGNIVCDPISFNVKIAEAPSHGQSIFEYAPDSAGALDYKAFVDRVVSDV